ncbi:MAG: metalloregulator ArsR/SmtB family transcription factor [Ornithinimicrobium sp.]|nr:metalloregulator ArsR/SmtB family transcription factor [Ornithinimicrobium sp.]MDO5740566.1 metalloregulator ArsR/SmtB family transcription factor [Ornithinimicrobium sp.]
MFKALAHPARIRILELLVAAGEPLPVSSLLETLGLEASLLSQHLRVLRQHHVVTSTRSGNAVTYQVSHPQIESLLLAARGFLLDHLAVQQRTLAMAAQL